MKKNENPLEFSQKLEAFQTARKAKEVNEIYTFDRMKEGLKQQHLTISRRMDKLRQKSLRQRVEAPEIGEEEIVRETLRTLQELTEFEQDAYNAHVDAPDNEFETIAAMQGFSYRYDGDPGLKQLPEAHADVFDHELNALTERELRKELELNEKALRESLKKPGRLELSSESPPKEPQPPQPAPAEVADVKEREEPEQEAKRVSVAEPEIRETPEQPAAPEKKPSGSSLIYFRSSPPSSDE